MRPVGKLKSMHDHSEWQSVWMFYQDHNGPYQGPTCGDELKDLEREIEKEGLRIFPEDDTDEFPMCTYHENGKPESERHSDGSETTWDEGGKVCSRTNEYGETWTYQYDGRDNLISETHPNGDKYIYEYDKHNKMISAEWPDGHVEIFINNESRKRDACATSTRPAGGKTLTTKTNE